MLHNAPTNSTDVAIIGAGFCGCSAAYFLRKLLPTRCTITVFEKSDRLGGRVRSFRTDGGELYETGGAIFTSNHQYMNAFVDEFSLKKFRHPPKDGAFCLLGGRKGAVFSSKPAPFFLNRIRFALRYGANLFRFQRYANKHTEKWSKVYDLQNKGVSFNSPVELLNGISSDFRVMLESSYGKWLDIVVGAGATFCKEVAYGFPATSFATGLKIQAFAGMASVGGSDTNLYSVVGGNEQIAQRLCEFAVCQQGAPSPSGSAVLLKTTVKRISKGSKKRFRLTYTSEGKEDVREFNYVVIALPMHSKAEALPEIDTDIVADSLPIMKRSFAEVDYTLFRGELSAECLHLPEEKLKDVNIGVTILPTEEAYNSQNTLFHYLGRAWSTAAPSSHPSSCWATVSRPVRCPTPGQRMIDQYVLKGGELVKSTRWFAYPEMPKFPVGKDQLGFFWLARGLIHASLLEYAASTMEMALIGGRNAALLIAEEEQKLTEDDFKN